MRASVLRVTALVAVLVLLSSVAACRVDGSHSASPHAPGGAELGIQIGHPHDPEVRWQTVDSFDEMVRSSDLVVRGTVERRRPAWARHDGWKQATRWLVTSQEDGEEHHDLPLVISTVRIRNVLRAGAQAGAAVGGGTIEIVELGGRLVDGCFSEPEDKPVLERGEEAVFFLSSAGRPGAYQVVGGWQGRMWVRDGKIHSLAAERHPSDAAATAHDRRPVTELLQAIARVP